MSLISSRIASYSFRCRRSLRRLSTCFKRQRSQKPKLRLSKNWSKLFFRWHLLRLKTFPIPSDDAYCGFFASPSLQSIFRPRSIRGRSRDSNVGRERGSARSEVVLPSDGEGTEERGGGGGQFGKGRHRAQERCIQRALSLWCVGVGRQRLHFSFPREIIFFFSLPFILFFFGHLHGGMARRRPSDDALW